MTGEIEEARSTIKPGDVLFAGETRRCVVTKVTAKQFKMREQHGSGYTGYEETRPIEEFGTIWFATFDEAIIVAYERAKLRAQQARSAADLAMESKRKMREKYASILTGIEG